MSGDTSQYLRQATQDCLQLEQGAEIASLLAHLFGSPCHDDTPLLGVPEFPRTTLLISENFVCRRLLRDFSDSGVSKRVSIVTDIHNNMYRAFAKNH
jgi:hypothetical protein